MAKIYFEGLEDLNKKLKKNVKMDTVKRTIQGNGKELLDKATKNAEFKGHYKGKKFITPSGTTQRSIPAAGPEISNGGLTVTVGATTEYAEYVENGTRFMEAQPFVGPAFNIQKEIFKKDMKKLVK